uniref:C3H1-type domain-containing protein n=1 Tax=Alexandrium fundyense TaxID=2932 RepID=A4UHE3_ALEFU|nr:unknown [Alexandrium fundyense]
MSMAGAASSVQPLGTAPSVLSVAGPTHIVYGSVERLGESSSGTSGLSETSHGSVNKKRTRSLPLPLRSNRQDIVYVNSSSSASSLRGEAAPTHSAEPVEHSIPELAENSASQGKSISLQAAEVPSPVEPASAAAAEAQGLPSPGSAAHDLGKCKPCLFLVESIGCISGEGCSFCHFPHNRRTMPRPSKGKRDRFRKYLEKIEVKPKTTTDQGQGGTSAQPSMLVTL